MISFSLGINPHPEWLSIQSYSTAAAAKPDWRKIILTLPLRDVTLVPNSISGQHSALAAMLAHVIAVQDSHDVPQEIRREQSIVVITRLAWGLARFFQR